MEHLQNLVRHQVKRCLNVSEEEFDYLLHPQPGHLHDPLYYKGMRDLVVCLHRFKQRQQEEKDLVLMVDGDYDTDGICASIILTAALSVFGIRFQVYVPTMADGYGLSKTAVDKMQAQAKNAGLRVGMILTADNGIAAFSGVSYAVGLGITVLITDHHPAGDRIPNAAAVVDPNCPGDVYPFKGNSGACVAWKAMLAYAELCDRDKKPLIERLIVFAGLSNVADVMPMRGENRYTVTAALKIIKDMLSVGGIPYPDYKAIADTPYPEYNTAFHGLYDLIALRQEEKDRERDQKRKARVPLPLNEELFSWYLSPMMNAPRRVHDTCLEGLAPFLVRDVGIRRQIIQRLLELNKEKSELCGKVLEHIPDDVGPSICVNVRKGICGLIAGKIAEKTGKPSVVFSCFLPEDETVIYDKIPAAMRISGSARSNENYPLNRIMERMNGTHPGLVSGGGHATAAGFSIEARNFETFQRLLEETIERMEVEADEEAVPSQPTNTISLIPSKIGIEAVYQTVGKDGKIEPKTEKLDVGTFANDAARTVQFLESLRPFGEGYLEETTFLLWIDEDVYKMGWNPDFWKTFKFSMFGVEVLTFDVKLAEKVKDTLAKGGGIAVSGKLKLNEFRGKVTPQLLLS